MMWKAFCRVSSVLLLLWVTFAPAYGIYTFPTYSSQIKEEEHKERLRRLRELKNELLNSKTFVQRHKYNSSDQSYAKGQTDNIFLRGFEAFAETVADGFEYLFDNDANGSLKTDTVYKKRYELPADVAEALHTQGCNVHNWSTFVGTVQQHALHQEFTDIVQRATKTDFSGFNRVHTIDLAPVVIELADIGVGYNKAADIEQAALLVDFCEALVDYGVAYAKDITLYAVQNIEQAGKRVAHCAEKIIETVGLYTQQACVEIQDIYEHDRLYARTIVQDAVTSKVISVLLPRLCQCISPLFGTASSALLGVAQKFVQQRGWIVEFAGSKMPFLLRVVKKGGEKALAGAGQVADKVGNMKEFFVKFPFGQAIKDSVEKTNMMVQGQSVYRVIKKIPTYKLDKGDLLYLDNLHKDHFEVFTDSNKFKKVISLYGEKLFLKSQRATGRKL